MKIRCCHISQGLGRKQAILDGYDFIQYDPKEHTKSPTFFIGMYTEEDLKILENHNGIARVMFCGEDARKSNWLHDRLNKLDRPRVQTYCAKILDDVLAKQNVYIDEVRNIYVGNHDLFKPASNKSNKIYCYIPYNRRQEYGIDFLAEIAKSLPEATFVLARWGENKLPFPNSIALPIWLDERIIPSIMKDCCCVMRTVEQDGFSSGLVEGALLDLPVICRQKHGVDWIAYGDTPKDYVEFYKKVKDDNMSKPRSEVKMFVDDHRFLEYEDGIGPVFGIVITNSREKEIKEALLSLHKEMDKILLVDTGVKDNTIEIAKEVVGKDRLFVHEWAWRDDFSAARNEALRVATELGASWGVFLDSDMRYVGATNIRLNLQQAVTDILYVTARGGHIQPLIFKLPTKYVWSGRAHNAVSHSGTMVTIPNVSTWELSKTPERQKARFEQTRDLLLKMAEEQETPRTWYYLGDTYEGLGEKEKALECYRKCADMWGWDEEAAWACFRAADMLMCEKRYKEALIECGRGLTHHAGICELAWIAGVISWRMGNPKQAVYWAKLALVWAENVDKVYRVGFREPSKIKWGAWDVLRFALKAIGDNEGAQEAERKFQELSK